MEGELEGNFSIVFSLAFPQNEEYLASGGDDSRICVWKIFNLIGIDINFYKRFLFYNFKIIFLVNCLYEKKFRMIHILQ